jgi:hypothetical protein
MKTLSTPNKPGRPRVSRTIRASGGSATISKAEADRFTDGLLKIAGRIKGLPSDFARNHDHYLHGLPKK